jgi:hypothetical protein
LCEIETNTNGKRKIRSFKLSEKKEGKRKNEQLQMKLEMMVKRSGQFCPFASQIQSGGSLLDHGGNFDVPTDNIWPVAVIFSARSGCRFLDEIHLFPSPDQCHILIWLPQ